MKLLPPDSILRCFPDALDQKSRRLIGALAYAIDGAELSFTRLRIGAEAYVIPSSGGNPSLSDWPPSRRLAIVVDAWAFVDHVSRARKLVGRLPTDKAAPPVEVTEFLAATLPANKIRNRLQHLDEDIFNGEHVDQRHPILGHVGWTDGRMPTGFFRYSVSSGPSNVGGTWASSVMREPPVDSVGHFTLMASDLTVDLDALHNALIAFTTGFEVAARISISEGLKREAAARGVEPSSLCASGVTDTVTAMRFDDKKPEKWTWNTELSKGLAEVSPNSFRLDG